MKREQLNHFCRLLDKIADLVGCEAIKMVYFGIGGRIELTEEAWEIVCAGKDVVPRRIAGSIEYGVTIGECLVYWEQSQKRETLPPLPPSYTVPGTPHDFSFDDPSERIGDVLGEQTCQAATEAEHA